MENLNYSISIKEVDCILFPYFQKILPDIPSHSFCFNYCLYPDEFQISISRPNFSLEPQILYPTVYLTFPLGCPNSPQAELTTLSPHLHSTSSFSVPNLTGMGRPGAPIRILGVILDSSFSSVLHIQSVIILPVEPLQNLTSPSNPFQPHCIILVQSTFNSHFDPTFVF